MAHKEQVKIYGNDKLSDRVNLFKQQAEKHAAKQKSNPFSGQFKIGVPKRTDIDNLQTNSNNNNVATNSTGMSKDDPRYGRPPEGSKTEFRGLKAASHISREIYELCNLIKEFGSAQNDGSFTITFGELFQLYTVISNKVVGLLLRARKHGLLHFEGEMLFQRRDDHVIITLFPEDLSSDESE